MLRAGGDRIKSLIEAVLNHTHNRQIVNLALQSDSPYVKPLTFSHLTPLELVQAFLDLPPEEGFYIYESLLLDKDPNEPRHWVGLFSKSFQTTEHILLRDASMDYLRCIANEHQVEIWSGIKNIEAPTSDERYRFRRMYPLGRL